MASAALTFKNKLVETICERLAARGFVRYRKGLVDLPFDDDFHYWLGLGHGLHGDAVTLFPNVGVHAVRVMRMFYACRGTPYNRGVMTYNEALGLLVEGYETYTFALDDAVGPRVDHLVDALMTHGLAYARSIASYDALDERVLTRVRLFGGYPEFHTGILMVQGRRAEAIRYYEHLLADHPSEQRQDFLSRLVNWSEKPPRKSHQAHRASRHRVSPA